MQMEVNIVGEISMINSVQLMKADIAISRISATSDGVQKSVPIRILSPKTTSSPRLLQISTGSQ